MSDHTFGSQSAAWLQDLAQRKRKPVAPAALHAFGAYVRRLLPIIGPDTELATIDNGAMKAVVTQLVDEKLSPKTILEMVATVKQIVGSAVDANGSQLFSRTWNSKFIDAPQIGKQAQPCATKDDVERCLKNAASYQEQLFYAVLAGAGLRVAQVLSIHVRGTEQQTSWNESTATISVCSSIYRGKEQNRVKTPAAIRTVDLDPRLNTAIACFVSENGIQPGTFLFKSKSRRAMHLLTATVRLKKHNVPGFHAFRRFRITWLRDLGVREDIIRFWVGHAAKDITDRYSKLAENVELRKKWALRAGLGFSLDHLGKPGDPRPLAAKAAKTHSTLKRRTGPPQIGEIAVAGSDPTANEGSGLADVSAEPMYIASDDDLPAELFETPVPVAQEV
jgi:integrase